MPGVKEAPGVLGYRCKVQGASCHQVPIGRVSKGDGGEGVYRGGGEMITLYPVTLCLHEYLLLGSCYSWVIQALPIHLHI